MYDEGKKYADSKRPSEKQQTNKKTKKKPKKTKTKNHFPKLYTDNMSTYDVENPNYIDKMENILLACIILPIFGKTERMNK